MMKVIKRQTKTDYTVDTNIPLAQSKLLETQFTVDSGTTTLPDDVYPPSECEPERIADNAATFTTIDKSVLHVSQWMRHIYPANKGDISWMFKTEKGMWFKIEVLRGFATVSYGHGNIHAENAHWVKTHTWKESGAIQAMKQRAIAEEKFKLEKPSQIAVKAIEEDII
jgi:hypothetical protein